VKLRHWFDVLVLILTGSFIFALWNPRKGLIESDEIATLLGIILFLKWFRFLTYLRQFEVIGRHILPITSTMLQVGPFLLVLGVYLLASTNLYWAFRNDYNVFECFLLIYRLAVLGDFDISELEHKNTPTTRLDSNRGTISTDSTVLSVYDDAWYSVRLMLVVVSFMIGVLIMNLFIAVLCSSYDLAASVAQECFMQSRANIVLDQIAVRTGRSCFGNNACQRRLKRKQAMPESMRDAVESGSYECDHRIMDVRTLSSTNSMNAMAMMLSKPSAQQSFLWYVKQAPD